MSERLIAKPRLSLAAQPSKPATRTISSRTLFAGSREIEINHEGATYRMRITRQGKLILNK